MSKLVRVLATILLYGWLTGLTHAAPCAGFSDVDDTSSFCPNVNWIKNRSITLGCAAGLYCPDDPVNRLQMAAFLNRLGDSLFPLTCAAGQVMKWNGLQWSCANDNGGAGSVTSVLAGTGLQASPNPIVGAGSLNLAPTFQLPQGCGVNQIARWAGSGWTCADAGGAGTLTSLAPGVGIVLTPNPITTTGTVVVDTAYVQRRVSGSCVAGSSIRAIAADGTVSCEVDDAGPANAFVQGGNAFGALAVLGTTDDRSMDFQVNGNRALRIIPGTTPNLIGGYSGNSVQIGFDGQTIAGGGGPGSGCFEPSTGLNTRSCANFALNAGATVGGGRSNLAQYSMATVGGGQYNTAGANSTVAGGSGNRAEGFVATVAGGGGNVASGGFAAVGGGTTNSATNSYATVAGGNQNIASNFAAAIGGGYQNTAVETYATVGGGFSNDAIGDSSTVAGGYGNGAGGARATVGGGYGNVADGSHAVITGGSGNTAAGLVATVGGGTGNQANGAYSVVPGGSDNQASGSYSVAMGRGAIVNSPGSFVFADGTAGTFISGVANEFIVGASGGVGFYTQKGFGTFCRIAAGGGTWSCSSSRHVKRDFADVNLRDILQRVIALPVTSWRFKGEPASVRHVGPTAQDFRAAFSLGTDDVSIAQVDANGISLAAIKGLHLLAREQEAEIATLKKQVAELGRMVEGLALRAREPVQPSRRDSNVRQTP